MEGGRQRLEINKKNKLDFRRIGDENRVLARSGRAQPARAQPAGAPPERAASRSQAPSRVLRRAFSPPEAPSNKKGSGLRRKGEEGGSGARVRKRTETERREKRKKP
ncbi:hypothetical protein TIFTF001_045298 [Ficus carica]|uniref:Uncharacterized protein n=1 Tax=Ficus carica TaxID=3494 RepID=A0AA87YYC5_FICCA|nr:hypothetical protein TIFTF001_045298 [Ficus carica]